MWEKLRVKLRGREKSRKELGWLLKILAVRVSWCLPSVLEGLVSWVFFIEIDVVHLCSNTFLPHASGSHILHGMIVHLVISTRLWLIILGMISNQLWRPVEVRKLTEFTENMGIGGVENDFGLSFSSSYSPNGGPFTMLLGSFTLLWRILARDALFVPYWTPSKPS